MIILQHQAHLSKTGNVGRSENQTLGQREALTFTSDITMLLEANLNDFHLPKKCIYNFLNKISERSMKLICEALRGKNIWSLLPLLAKRVRICF